MKPRPRKLQGEEPQMSRGRTWVGWDQTLVGIISFSEGQVQ